MEFLKLVRIESKTQHSDIFGTKYLSRLEGFTLFIQLHCFGNIIFSADYWKSQGRKYCDFCKCWIADNKPSIEFHEGGRKHKENVSNRLKEIHKNSAKQAKQNRKFENDLKKMENAAMAAYMKDVENNTRDMTAQNIIKEKYNQTETGSKQNYGVNYNAMPEASPSTNPRFKGKIFRKNPQEIDPCDPLHYSQLPPVPPVPPPPKIQQPNENKGQGKGKGGKGKGKGKKNSNDDRTSKPITKLWYEALSPQGYTYYWHIETNESIWEPPAEGYMTFAEQEEEVKEQALQQELLTQLEEEEAIEKADIIEEQRANAEREKLREIKKRFYEQNKKDQGEEENEEDTGEEVVYRRDYSVPERPQPYGSWKTVQVIERKPIDLQLPVKKPSLTLPTFQVAQPPPIRRDFKEKTITSLKADDSDEESSPTVFKKMKFGNKNIRKRMND